MIALLLVVAGCAATVEFPPADSACWPAALDTASVKPDLDVPIDVPDEDTPRQHVRFPCAVTVR